MKGSLPGRPRCRALCLSISFPTSVELLTGSAACDHLPLQSGLCEQDRNPRSPGGKSPSLMAFSCVWDTRVETFFFFPQWLVEEGVWVISQTGAHNIPNTLFFMEIGQLFPPRTKNESFSEKQERLMFYVACTPFPCHCGSQMDKHKRACTR